MPRSHDGRTDISSHRNDDPDMSNVRDSLGAMKNAEDWAARVHGVRGIAAAPLAHGVLRATLAAMKGITFAIFDVAQAVDENTTQIRLMRKEMEKRAKS